MWIFETIKIVLRNVELEKMTTIKIVPIAEIGPPEAALKLHRPGFIIFEKKLQFFFKIGIFQNALTFLFFKVMLSDFEDFFVSS